MTRWKDVTSYSRGDTARVPKTWAIHSDGLRICVTRMHGVDDTWFMHCREINVSEHQLDATDLEDARTEAIMFVRSRLLRMLACLDTFGGSRA